MDDTPESPQRIVAPTLGAAWLRIASRILQDGAPASYDGLPITELVYATLDIATPDPDDAIIARYGDPERLTWMRANFTERTSVAELGDADSYATRLYDYAHTGRDQIAWVIDHLHQNPASRSATITTFQPLTDTSYIPCVSLLDFWMPGGTLELAVYAHSIDFGTKGYGNLVELAAVQRRVADALNVRAGRLVMTVKSAHIYATERESMLALLAAGAPR